MRKCRLSCSRTAGWFNVLLFSTFGPLACWMTCRGAVLLAGCQPIAPSWDVSSLTAFVSRGPNGAASVSGQCVSGASESHLPLLGFSRIPCDMAFPYRLRSSTLVCSNDGRPHTEGKESVMGEQPGSQSNRLCESCQLGCKQSSSTEVLLCPRYSAVPKQATLLGNLNCVSVDVGIKHAATRLA